MPLDIDRFAEVASPIQRWDPRVKMATLMVLLLTVSLLKSLPMAALSLILALSLIRLSALPTHFVSHWMEGIILFLAPFFLVMPFTYPGEPAFTVLGMGFAWEGLRYATLIFIKAMAVVLISFTIFGTARFDVSMISLQKLRVPSVLVQMVLFTYRYVYVFTEEMKTMAVAMGARGFVPKTNMYTMKVLGGFLGSLLVRSFERTERVYKAMLSKGYTGQFYTLTEFQTEPKDFVKGAMAILAAVLIYSTDRLGPFVQAVDGWF